MEKSQVKLLFELSANLQLLKNIFFSFSAVFKGNTVGPWKQFRSKISNINFFASMMASEKIILKTSGPECSYAGDYLRFDNIIIHSHVLRFTFI